MMIGRHRIIRLPATTAIMIARQKIACSSCIFRTHGRLQNPVVPERRKLSIGQQEVKYRRADRQTPDQLSLSHLADNAHVHKSRQRRDCSKRHGNGSQHHHSVRYVERPCYAANTFAATDPLCLSRMHSL